jgi:hypothetical protein
MGLLEIAQQIADLTRILHDGDRAAPGVPVHFEVLPGALPALPSTASLDKVKLSNDFSTLQLRNVQFQNAAVGGLGALTGSIVGGFTGKVLGDLSGTLDTLANPPSIVVKFGVRKQGNPAQANDFIASPSLNPSTNASDGLQLSLLLRPDIVENTNTLIPAQYEVTITISVTLTTPAETAVATRTIAIPISVPPIALPTVLLIGRHVDFRTFDGDAGALLVMLRGASPLRDLGALAAVLNEIAGIIYKLEFLGMLTTGLKFADMLGFIVQNINEAPYLYLSVGNMGNFEDFSFSGIADDFDGQASSAFLLGVANASAAIHEEQGFNGNYKVYAVPDIVLNVGAITIDTGVGYVYDSAFTTWSSGEGGMDNSASSARLLVWNDLTAFG